MPDPEIAQLRSELADHRGRFSRLENALGAQGEEAALAEIRALRAAVATLQQQVGALNAWAATVTPAGP